MSFGLSFDCACSFAEILGRLNSLGPWTWHERDSAWFGNIASARTASLRLDLIESGANEIPGGSVDAGNGQRFAFSIRAASGATPSGPDYADVEAIFRVTILPALGASRVQPTDPID